jgi:protein-tyrosine phosphatase
MTRSGVYWRSGSPDRLDAAGWAELRASGITTVVDLRNPQERADVGNAPDGIRVLALPLEDVDDEQYATTWSHDWATPDFYVWGRSRWPELWSAVLGAIADAPGGVLFHCAGGRDRTGMVAAVLLEAAGVDRREVLDDYVLGIREAPRRDIDHHIDEYRSALDRLLDGIDGEPDREPELHRAAARLR